MTLLLLNLTITRVVTEYQIALIRILPFTDIGYLRLLLLLLVL